MKKLLFFILNFCFVAAMGQNLIRPITISLPPNPPANTADWATAMPPVIIMAQTKMDSGRISPIVTESKILVTIKSSGAVICGSYNQQSAPQSNFNSMTKTWSGAAINTLLGKDCILKPGSYELCVQFYIQGPTGNILLGEACKSFIITDTKQQSYSQPQNILPPNGKVFTEQEAGMPIMLRWTPVLPKPKADVQYKVRVVEILPGQNKTEALKTNTPIDIQEVKNQTQTNTKLSKRCNGCEYVWNVEASKKSQMGDLEMLGTSEATTFSVKSGETKPEKFNPPVNQSPANGKVFTREEAAQPVLYRWTPVIPRPKEDVVYKVRVVEIKEGQSRAEALKANALVEVLEVKNETQATSKLSKRCNGCEYVWNVEASKKSAMGDIEMLGTSEASMFTINKNNQVTVGNVNPGNPNWFCELGYEWKNGYCVPIPSRIYCVNGKKVIHHRIQGQQDNVIYTNEPCDPNTWPGTGVDGDGTVVRYADLPVIGKRFIAILNMMEEGKDWSLVETPEVEIIQNIKLLTFEAKNSQSHIKLFYPVIEQDSTGSAIYIYPSNYDACWSDGNCTNCIYDAVNRSCSCAASSQPGNCSKKHPLLGDHGFPHYLLVPSVWEEGSDKLKDWFDYRTLNIRFFEYTEDFVIDNPILCKNLGVKQLVIAKGKYNVDYNDNNGEGTFQLLLANPIKLQNGKTSIPERTYEGVNPKGQDCKGVGNACFFAVEPVGNSNMKKYTIKPIIEKGNFKAIVVKFKGVIMSRSYKGWDGKIMAGKITFPPNSFAIFCPTGTIGVDGKCVPLVTVLEGNCEISDGMLNGKKELMSNEQVNNVVGRYLQYGVKYQFKGAVIKNIDAVPNVAAVYYNEADKTIQTFIIPLLNENGYLKMQGVATLITQVGDKQTISKGPAVASKKHDYVGHVTLLR